MNWTKEEVILTVRSYFEMFRKELDSIPYNKTEYRKALIPQLNNRTDAVEFKHRNISAILANMSLPYIKGYKPLFNYQQLLEDEVIVFLKKNKQFFEKQFEKFAKEGIELSQRKINFETLIDSKSPAQKELIKKAPLFLPIKTNYLEKEQNNRSLGEKGEQLVCEYEKWRLINAGKEKLAESVEWVSKTKGDGLGYDILSKETNGSDMFIEVKTTKLAKETPIYLSTNELEFAKLKDKEFYLYRVFNYEDNPQIFIKRGSYENFCALKPQIFKGYF